jgi:hypothetical protein
VMPPTPTEIICAAGMFPVPRSGKPGRGRGDERIALFGNGFLGINCYRHWCMPWLN